MGSKLGKHCCGKIKRWNQNGEKQKGVFCSERESIWEANPGGNLEKIREIRMRKAMSKEEINGSQKKKGG